MLETQVNVLVNREAALDRVGGDEELLAEIARLFIEDYPRMIDDIRAAVAANDATNLEHAAHALKGSVANFGADPARDAAFELEKMGRSRDLSSAAAALARLESVFAKLLPELEALGNP
jgi:HPt (histidine-containing phosphotransfer) domain-containing protein